MIEYVRNNTDDIPVEGVACPFGNGALRHFSVATRQK